MAERESASFNEIWIRLRKKYGKTQSDLASTDKRLKLSPSMVAMIEKGERGSTKKLSREQVLHFIARTNASPQDADEILAAAGLDTLRTEKEELSIQENFPLKEIWIFARVIRDQESFWFDVVSRNIVLKSTKYVYFTADEVKFLNFHERLKSLHPNVSHIDNCLECYLLPKEMFAANFAIYNPGTPESYCCGAVNQVGRGILFYTSAEGDRLYEMLEAWRDRIIGSYPISLSTARRIFPLGGGESNFDGRG